MAGVQYSFEQCIHSIIHIGYGLEIDMWALGVILYILLCGFPPFRSPARKQTELFQSIKDGNFEFLRPYWDNNSKSKSVQQSVLLAVVTSNSTQVEQN